MNPDRKLSVGDTLNEVFALYQQNFGVLIPAAFWLFLVVAILDGIVGNKVGLLGLVAILTFAVAMLYQGMVVSLVRDVQDGTPRLLGRRADQLGRAGLSTLIGASSSTASGSPIGFFLLIVPGCILLTIWAVIAPVIVIERAGVAPPSAVPASSSAATAGPSSARSSSAP